MSNFVVDVESDGPYPPQFSMVSFGCVLINPDGSLTKTFYGRTKPIAEDYLEDALAVSGITRQQHLTYPEPKLVMPEFNEWVKANNVSGRATFVSDNPAFDWCFMNFYLWQYTHENIFGHSARRIGDLYCGLVRDASKNHEWKKQLRKTKHTHNPVDDAMGNAEALVSMQKMGLKIRF